MSGCKNSKREPLCSSKQSKEPPSKDTQSREPLCNSKQSTEPSCKDTQSREPLCAQSSEPAPKASQVRELLHKEVPPQPLGPRKEPFILLNWRLLAKNIGALPIAAIFCITIPCYITYAIRQLINPLDVTVFRGKRRYETRINLENPHSVKMKTPLPSLYEPTETLRQLHQTYKDMDEEMANRKEQCLKGELDGPCFLYDHWHEPPRRGFCEPYVFQHHTPN